PVSTMTSHIGAGPVTVITAGTPSLVAKIGRPAVGDEVQLLAPRPGTFSYTFAGRAGANITTTAATTAQQVYSYLITNFPALGPSPATVTIPNGGGTVSGNNPNIDVFGPNGGPFYVVFYNNLATTNVPQII